MFPFMQKTKPVWYVENVVEFFSQLMKKFLYSEALVDVCAHSQTEFSKNQEHAVTQPFTFAHGKQKNIVSKAKESSK